jgi:methylated-DNA-[protein]-cysteine S-methyltransferase
MSSLKPDRIAMDHIMDEDITTAIINSPLGGLELRASANAILALNWIEVDATPPSNSLPISQAASELDAYFAKDLRDFTVKCRPAGDAFQRAVWAAMCEIPYGETATYGDIADIVGKPARAVGGACGRNPIPIIIPCHRVVGAGGRMVGYSGKGGVETKQWLLQHEGALLL